MKRCNLVGKTVFASVSLLLLILLQPTGFAQYGRIEQIRLDSESLKGNLLGDSATRNVTIFVPSKYDEAPEERFPVVYLFHGFLGTNTLWTGGDYVKDLNIAVIADHLIATGQIRPMILVAPDCRNAYGGSWYTNSPVTGNWEDFVTQDLIRYIDAKYRTIPKRTSRAIAGHSMGGHGAIKIAMKHPELYSALYAMSPACVDFLETLKNPYTDNFVEAAAAKTETEFPKLHWRSRAFVALAAAIAPDPGGRPFLGKLPLDGGGNRVKDAWQRWLQQDLATTMLAEYAGNLRKYNAVALDCGSEEDLLPMNIAFSTALNKAGVRHTFEKFDGTHTSRVASQLEEKVLPLFSKTLTFSTSPPVAVPSR